MEKVKCPNPKCGRRILDIEVVPPGKLVLEMEVMFWDAYY